MTIRGGSANTAGFEGLVKFKYQTVYPLFNLQVCASFGRHGVYEQTIPSNAITIDGGGQILNSIRSCI